MSEEEKITQKQARAIFDWMRKHKDATFEAMTSKFCADYSIYEGKVLLFMSYEFHRGGEWSDSMLLSKAEHDQFKAWDGEVRLGEVNGKHSDVYLSYADMDITAIDNPEDIYLRIQCGETSSFTYGNEVYQFLFSWDGGALVEDTDYDAVEDEVEKEGEQATLKRKYSPCKDEPEKHKSSQTS